jgi:hypothetical protein
MGAESDSGGPSGASVRGQVGLTKKEQNQRANAQERGGRQSAGVAKGSMRAGAAPARSSGNYGAMSPSDVADESMDRSVDRFTTSTTGAYRDLDDRVNKGQISDRVQNLPSVIGMAATGLNNFGKSRAADIRSQISAGGTAVYDTTGRIQGVVSKKDTPFGESEVYTGGSQYDPTGLGKSVSTGVGGRGIVMTSGDISVGERMRGGRDGGDVVGGTKTAATSTNVTGSTTQLSSAARRTSVAALGSGSGGANRRQFIG